MELEKVLNYDTTCTLLILTSGTDITAMAFELAKKGCDILLISRTLEKLNACKEEILAKYPSVTGVCARGCLLISYITHPAHINFPSCLSIS